MLEEKDLQAIAQLMDSRIGESEKRMANGPKSGPAEAGDLGRKHPAHENSSGYRNHAEIQSTGGKSKNHAGQISAEE